MPIQLRRRDWVKPMKRSEKSRFQKQLKKRKKESNMNWDKWFAWQTLLREIPITEFPPYEA